MGKFFLLMTLLFCIVACGEIRPTSTSIPGITVLVTNQTGTNPTPTASLTLRPANSPTVPITIVPTVPITRNSWEYNWLKGIPCSPPCWEGITPGKTTAKEVISLLSKNPIIKRVSTIPDNAFGFSYITWSWLDTIRAPFSDGYNNGGSVRFLTADPEQVITSIYSGYGKLGVKFQLDEVTKAYGEPSHILVIDNNMPEHTNGITYLVKIIWTQQGFDFTFNSKLKNEVDSLLSSPKITLESGPEFFALGIDGFFVNYPTMVKDTVVPWQGFKGFAFYCREVERNGSVSNCREAK